MEKKKKQNSNNNVNTKNKKIKNIINRQDKQQLIDRVIFEESLVQILKYDPINNDFF